MPTFAPPPGSPTTAGGGFTPASIIADRYRVVALLGRGGMGEVYRADDLKLGQPVALKFLPRALASDRSRLDRFLAEVRLARQVSHPNVCRVYDISEIEGHHFLSMELIDGEDLRSLLKRIGRLPSDKALDIARQIGAGLAAAHDRGVLHRDLKPANVMLDGRGHARITDFGLAAATDDAALAHDASGTPAYMAPEQLAGKGASVQSDIYALGLVLYELYTGKHAFAGISRDRLRSNDNAEIPTAPSDVIADMDPDVERVILRALAPDPHARPASVGRMLATLPGGNALEAALRAGETPSPEMVAAAGTKEGVEPFLAWTLLALVVAGIALSMFFGARGLVWHHAPPDRPPEVLAAKGREVLAALGYRPRPIDHASGFEVDLEYLRYLANLRSVWRSQPPDPSVLRFWYRESARPLEAWRFPFLYGNVSRITPADPPLDVAGMALVRLDPSGHLTQLVVVPTAGDERVPGPVNWDAVLAATGFDPAAWQATPPLWNPPNYADARAAWQGTWPNAPHLPVRLEAAALDGRAVYFVAVFPWTSPAQSPRPILTANERIGVMILMMILGGILLGAAIVARRNLRAGRGDRRGARRLSVFAFGAMLISWFFGESHVATLWEVALIVMAVSLALFAGAFVWLAYLAVEPFLRRRWPEVLVSWTRLLAGEFRDSLVGRDVLVGCAAGTLLAVVAIAGLLLPEWVNQPSNPVFADAYGLVHGVRGVVPLLVWRSAQAVMAGLATVFVLLLLRLALRSQRAAIIVFVVGSSLLGAAGPGPFWMAFSSTAIHLAVFVMLIARFGLLAAVVQFYVWGLLIFFPVTVDLGAWYAGAGVTAILVLAALTLFGFTTALAGRPAFGRATFEE